MPTYILGVSALYHDAAAVLLCDGVIVAGVQEERFSRLKHDATLPVRSAKWCMDRAGITAADLSWVVFYEKPLRKFERILSTSVATFPRSWAAFPRHMRVWLGDKLWLRGNLCAAFGIPASKVLFCEHHLSHAASAFFASPHENAAILCVDGVGEWATTSLWRGRGTQIEPVSEVRFPHSIGLFYSAITAHLGFSVNEGEFKVMGMAAYGQPCFEAEMNKLLRLESGGGYSLDMDYFSWHWHPTQAASPKLAELLGGGRFPGTAFTPRLAAEGASESEIEVSQRFADLAASAQAHTEAAMLHLVKHAHATVGTEALCYAGGVALNSVANHRIAAEGPFDHVWVQPAAGDAGGALGAALWAWHAVLGNPRGPAMTRTDIGRDTPITTTREILDDLGARYTDVGDEAPERAADDLADGKVIGWMNGRCEWGPRALGYRSILADPRKPETRDAVNVRVKYREPFRPFAPSVVAEKAGYYFDIPPAAAAPSRFMLTAGGVKVGARDSLGAVTHVDGTARVQVVDAASSPAYHRLISRFGEHTGVPVVLNTSFNLKGEPVVSSPVDAMASFVRSGLDLLYIDNFRVERPK